MAGRRGVPREKKPTRGCWARRISTVAVIIVIITVGTAAHHVQEGTRSDIIYGTDSLVAINRVRGTGGKTAAAAEGRVGGRVHKKNRMDGKPNRVSRLGGERGGRVNVVSLPKVCGGGGVSRRR